MVHPSQENFCRLWGQLVVQSWDDPELKERLLRDPAAVLREHGYELDASSKVRLQVVASSEAVQYLYLPSQGELPDNGGAEAAGELASQCLNNRLVLARLSTQSFDRRSRDGSPEPAARAASLQASLVFRLRPEVTVTAGPEGELAFALDGSRVEFRRLASRLHAALLELSSSGVDEELWAERIEREAGANGLARLYYSLDRLARRGFLVRTAYCNGLPLVTMIPSRAVSAFSTPRIAPEQSYILSRFAYCRREGSEMFLESPTASARFVLHDGRATALLFALAQPRRITEPWAQGLELPGPALTLLVELFAAAGVLCELTDHGTASEDETPSLRTWEFHDLLFHVRTRFGRHEHPMGGTCRFLGQLAPPPALKPVPWHETVDLYRPDLARLEREDPPFAAVLESRRSIRAYGERPMSDRQLGEFLYRVARVREQGTIPISMPAGSVRLGVALRPYPTGGALYELEIYAAINACENLEPGLYHYDPLGHRLGKVCGRTADVEALLHGAGRSIMNPDAKLQVLLILAARFPRVAWKYAAVAYGLILKHVGVVYQTMYLAATAMGLSPCALGCGDSDLFARTAGTDYYAETSVGEFLLGSMP